MKYRKKPVVVVSIHAPVWGATTCYKFTNNYRLVSIHAPVWGATVYWQQVKTPVAFQSTHPCGVRQQSQVEQQAEFVSIHAPVWGATIFALKSSIMCSLFQSTHPCGVRRVFRLSVCLVSPVSIHAPVWGATKDTLLKLVIESVSIHAPVWGATFLAS